MTTTLDHPLCVWLNQIHETRIRSSVPVKRLRSQAERLLLHTHRPSHARPGCCTRCMTSGERGWPCQTWKIVASGWAHCAGYQPEWTPRRPAYLPRTPHLVTEEMP